MTADPPARSFFVCYHPLAQRRTYHGVRVCRECLSVTAGGSAWQPARRWLVPATDGRVELLADNGVILSLDWHHTRTRG